MRSRLCWVAALFALTSAAEGQVTYCRDIGGNKTYCSGGMVIHRFGNTTVIPNAMPAQPPSSALQPNPLLQNNSLPTMNAPRSAAGSQNTLSGLPPPAVLPARPDLTGAPVILIPPSDSRVCHQFGTTLVCN